MFIAEKGLEVEKREVDLMNGEQLTPEFMEINPFCTVPVLELDDGTRLRDNASIARYLEETHPTPPLLGTTPIEKAMIAEWDMHVLSEGFAAVGEAFRNRSKGFKGRATTGPVGFEQIPELAERGAARAKNFLSLLDRRLAETEFVGGDSYSIADITATVTIDFAGWIKLEIGDDQKALRAWYDRMAKRPSYSA
jgi:glutathione S-transferase